MTRVLVVDDHPLFRDGLAELLRTVPDTEVVGSAADGERGQAPPSACSATVAGATSPTSLNAKLRCWR